MKNRHRQKNIASKVTFGPLGIFALEMGETGLKIGKGGASVILQQKPDGIERIRPDVAGSFRKHLGQLFFGELLVVDLVGKAQRIVKSARGEPETRFAPVDDVLFYVGRLVNPNGAVC